MQVQGGADLLVFPQKNKDYIQYYCKPCSNYRIGQRDQFAGQKVFSPARYGYRRFEALYGNSRPGDRKVLRLAEVQVQSRKLENLRSRKTGQNSSSVLQYGFS